MVNLTVHKDTLAIEVRADGWGIRASSRSPVDKGEIRDVLLEGLRRVGSSGSVFPTERADAALARLARELFLAAGKAGINAIALDN